MICTLLRTRTGVDFHLYKPATIQRRVARRMALQRADVLENYCIELLHKNPAELDALYEDIFVHVTGFFRDPGALAALQQTVFPRFCQTSRIPMPFECRCRDVPAGRKSTRSP